MNIYFIITVFILLSIAAISVYNQIKDRKLVETVTHQRRGTRSEQEMVLKLLKSEIKSTAIFHDLYLNNGNGKYTQIDLVVATKVGIVVFEIKDYSGWIFGTENQTNWTQVLAYGKRKYHFYNPIHQNRKHIEDLKKFYYFEDIPFFSMIVFFGNCEFKNHLNLPNRTFIIKSHQVMGCFNTILQNNQPTKYHDKFAIADFLKQAVKNGESSLIREKHIQNIQMLKLRNKFN